MLEILRARISYELAVPFERNKVFVIDDSRYFVIQVPYDGSSWEFEEVYNETKNLRIKNKHNFYGNMVSKPEGDHPY